MTCTPERWYGQPPRNGPALTSPRAPLPPTCLELDVGIDRALDDLRRAFPGLCIWHGEWSGSLWALLPDRLVEAKTSTDLARQLHAALPRPRPGVTRRSTPPTRRQDGTWTTPAVSSRSRTSRTRPASRARLALRRILTSGLI